jgi:hypothetical protein
MVMSCQVNIGVVQKYTNSLYVFFLFKTSKVTTQIKFYVLRWMDCGLLLMVLFWLWQQLIHRWNFSIRQAKALHAKNIDKKLVPLIYNYKYEFFTRLLHIFK